MLGILPKSGETRDWFDDNVDYEEWQMPGDAIWGENRYMRDILDALEDEGFVDGEDYEVLRAY